MTSIQAAINVPENQVVYDRSQLDSMFLPTGLMLMLDRVCHVKGPALVCEMDVLSHWVFPLHFPADPIFPGTLLIEAAGQAVAVWAWHAGFRGRPRLGKVSARYFSPVVPQDRTITLRATVRNRKCVFTGRVEISVFERKVAEVESVIFVIPPAVLSFPDQSRDGQASLT